MYLIFYTEQKAQTALEFIDSNMGFPDKQTETWAIINKAHEQDLWYFIKPNDVYMQDVVFDEQRSDISNLLEPILWHAQKKA
ncbi:MAG: hypothetical protein OHK0045_21960 [Raineya sp.]